MAEILQDKKKLTVNIVIALCYAIFTFLIVLRHEVWEDEAQVWLFARELSSLELFRNLFAEGHPPLFYLLVMPFAKIGLSVFSMQLLCWLASVFGVFLLFEYSPFKWWLNTSVVLSSGFLYAFPVIARNYSLIPVLLFLCAILYSKRREQPVLYGIVLFLLSMTHVIMLPFVFTLFLCFIFEVLREKRFNLKNLLSASIVVCGLSYVLLISFSAVEHNSFINYHSNTSIYTFVIFLIKFFSAALCSWSKISMNFVYGYLILFLILLFGILKFSLKAFFIAFVSVSGQFLIYVLFYFSPVYQTRIFSMFLIILFAYWICWREVDKESLKRGMSLLLSLFFLSTAYNGFKYISTDYFGAYSGSKETAEFIENNLEKDALLLSDVAQTSASVLSYLKQGQKIIYVPLNSEMKFALWDKDTQNGFTPEEWSEYLSKINDNQNVYLLLVEDKNIENTQSVFVSSDSLAKKEKFYILKYERKDDE